MSHENDLILLSGATGFIGFRTLIQALKAGYKVRCAIRSESKASGITSAPAVKALNLPESAISFCIVPDITVAGAYDEAAHGVTHIIHIASPLPAQNMEGHKNAEEAFIKPAVDGVLEMLRAAKRSPGVQKVVITSSVVALMRPKIWSGFEQSDQVFTPETRVNNISGPYASAGEAYCASKIASLNATDDWVKEERPSFGVINIHPSWVIGPSDLARSRKDFFLGTNRFMAAIALGKIAEVIGDRQLTGATVHVDDVAELHVMALKPEIKGYQGFIASIPMEWDGISKVVIDNFPKAIEEGLFAQNGKQPTSKIYFDTKETEKTFGFKFRDLQAQVTDGLNQFVKLPEEA